MATITVKPPYIQRNRSAMQRVTLMLTGAGWTQGGTTFTLTGVAGVAKGITIVDGGGLAIVAINSTGAAVGTVTVSDGTNTGTFVVKARAHGRLRWFPGLTDRDPR
jgi:hypothetical protein